MINSSLNLKKPNELRKIKNDGTCCTKCQKKIKIKNKSVDKERNPCLIQGFEQFSKDKYI